MSLKIAVVSETIIGYGSPQVPVFARAMAEHLQTRPLVFTPYDPIAPRRDLYPEIDIEVVPLRALRYKPLGRAQYLIKVAKRLNELKPEVLVLFCTYSVPVLRKLKYRPKKVIYYSLESLTNYKRTEQHLNRKLASQFDAVIFPEFNRAALDGARGGLLGRPTLVVYNGVHPKSASHQVKPAAERNGRIVHPGSIAYEVTFAEYFLDQRSRTYPLDIYGITYGDELKAAIAAMTGNVRYLGVIDEKTLAERRLDYSWGIVTWNPDTENGMLAAPNKLFDYIASGVPVLTAPHPQAAEIVKRYKCGLVMPDWSYESFQWAIEEALMIGRSEHYAKFVEGCVRAHQEELSWDHQFEKFLTVYEGSPR